MKKKECPSCAMVIPSTAKICPICGYEFPADNKYVSTMVVIILILILLYFLIREI